MESPCSRRVVLRSATVPLVVGVAGCTDERPEDVESVRVENWHADAHTVSVTVLVDGERHFSRTLEVPAVTDRGDVTDPGTATVRETIPGPGLFGTKQYEVTAILDGGPPETAEETTGEGFDSIEVRIGDDGSLDIAFMDAV